MQRCKATHGISELRPEVTYRHLYILYLITWLARCIYIALAVTVSVCPKLHAKIQRN